MSMDKDSILRTTRRWPFTRGWSAGAGATAANPDAETQGWLDQPFWPSSLPAGAAWWQEPATVTYTAASNPLLTADDVPAPEHREPDLMAVAAILAGLAATAFSVGWLIGDTIARRVLR